MEPDRQRLQYFLITWRRLGLSTNISFALYKGNHAFGERGGFAGPLAPDFWGPGPVQPPPEAFSATVSSPLCFIKSVMGCRSVMQCLVCFIFQSGPPPACPPQPPQKKDQLAPKETKKEPPKSMASKISMFKNISAK